MWRVRTSRWLNSRIFGGKPNQMLSTRCYLEHRYFWTLTFDWWFFLIRREQHHCYNSFCLDMEKQKYASTIESTTGKTKEETLA